MPAQPPPDRPVCAVCGGQELHLHLRVAGAPGPEGLTPATDRFGVALGDIVRCAGCGHMQLDRLPAGLASGYAAATGDEYLEEEAGQRATARSVLERLEPRAGIAAVDCPDGEEIFLLSGSLKDEYGTYRAGTWIRNPAGFRHDLESMDGATYWVKRGHLRPMS